MATKQQYDAGTAAATIVFRKFIEEKVPRFEQAIAEKFLGECVPGAAQAAIDASDDVAEEAKKTASLAGGA